MPGVSVRYGISQAAIIASRLSATFNNDSANYTAGVLTITHPLGTDKFTVLITDDTGEWWGSPIKHDSTAVCKVNVGHSIVAPTLWRWVII